MPRASRSNRGSASVEIVLATPVLLLLIMSVIQFGLWYHAEHVANAAAQGGVRAARSQDGSAAEGRRIASAFLDDAAGSLISHPKVDVSRKDGHARADVRGAVQSLIPGLHFAVTAHAASPVEEFKAAVP